MSMSFKATAMQNDVKFTVYEVKTDGKLSKLIENLAMLKKKTDEYYGKIISSSNFYH